MCNTSNALYAIVLSKQMSFKCKNEVWRHKAEKHAEMQVLLGGSRYSVLYGSTFPQTSGPRTSIRRKAVSIVQELLFITETTSYINSIP